MPDEPLKNLGGKARWGVAIVGVVVAIVLLLVMLPKHRQTPASETREPVTDLQPPQAPADKTANGRTPFRDCRDCPEMVAIQPGSFSMGSPDTEKGRYSYEGPVHPVHISPFAAGKYPITRGQWREYVRATNHPKASCNWERPGFSQDDNHPVVCITWKDAVDYAAWLTQKTGHHYRLLSEAEYEYVNRSGTSSRYFWGDSESDLCRYANGGETTFCKSRYANTSPVGTFLPNQFGLYDTTGNVWEWTKDCWNDSYNGAPSDGTPWEAGNCRTRVVRGAAWLGRGVYPSWFRAAYRYYYGDGADDRVGFRVARTP